METTNDTFPQIEGLRKTKNRKLVYQVLLEHLDHPTAAEVYESVKVINPDVSLATVYNSLETLVEHEAIRQVNFDRESSRYCTNLTEHGHFHDSTSGKIHDISFKNTANLNDFLNLPKGCHVTDLEITIRGTIPNQ